jgi:hypothetical protein
MPANERRKQSTPHGFDVEPEDGEAKELDGRRWRRRTIAGSRGDAHDRDDNRLLVSGRSGRQHQALLAASAIRSVVAPGAGNLEAENRS